MSDGRLPPNPRRLSREGGEAGDLLRSAEGKFREQLDESGAFRAIERLRWRRAVASWAGVLGAGVVAAFALSQGLGSLGRGPVEATLTAEPLPPPPVPEVAHPEEPPRQEPAAQVV